MRGRSGAVPDRLVAAVESLDVEPADQILEIGCGRGVAAELICDKLRTGRLIGLDRSATAIAAAQARNQATVAAGTARFLTTPLADVDPGQLGPGRFDKVLAVNVNLFWTGPARHELRLIADLLRPAGILCLCYDPPDRGRLAQLESRLTAHLGSAGFACDSGTRPVGRGTLLTVRAKPPR